VGVRVVRPWPRRDAAGSVAVMSSEFRADLAARTAALAEQGLFKKERVIASPQSARIRLADGSEVVNLCANNYLGLADHPALVEAAHRALDRYGYGMASVRFICGTQTVHRELEERIAAFLGMDDAILYSSCFDANTGLFETILDESDAVISDASTMPRLIGGIRRARRRATGTPTATWANRCPARGGEVGALPADRHRWRLFDGRDPCQPARHRRSRCGPRRHGPGG
jgi:hypothetical protein